MDAVHERTLPEQIDSSSPENPNSDDYAPAPLYERPPITLTIPRTILRRDPVRGSYIVYVIKVRIGQITEVTSTGCSSSTQNASIEWVVEHRYSKLARLHADLMGWLNPTADSESPVDEMYAHWCLPRPLPGIQQLHFPRKRRIPTLLPPPSYRWLACATKPTIQDTPVPSGKSRRVDQRRKELEVYLTSLINLIWKTSYTETVANVYSSMTASISETCRNDCTGYTDCQSEAIKKRLLNLLPILKPQF